MADSEIALDIEEPAKAVKKADKPKKEEVGVALPVLIEFTVTFSAIFVVIVFLTIVGISLVTGISLLAFVIRTSISLLLIGGLLVVISRQISFGILDKSMAKVEGKSEQKQSDEYQEVSMPGTSEAK